MTDKEAPIEEYYPIEKVNKLASKEGVGFLKQKYRPHLYTHLWFARRLGCVFRSILLYSLADQELQMIKKKNSSGNRSLNEEFGSDNSQSSKELVEIKSAQDLWDYYQEDVDFSDKRIMDPFMGGGTTTSEAVRFNAEVVGSELNPVAWFMDKKQLEPVDPELISEHKEYLESKVGEKVKEYYSTKCEECSSDSDIIYTFWTKKTTCLNCSKDVRLMKSWKLENDFGSDDDYVVICPDCGKISLKQEYRKKVSCDHCENKFNPNDGPASRTKHTCQNCGISEKTIEATKKRDEPLEKEMIAIKYFCGNCEKERFKKPNSEDLSRYEEASEELESKENELSIPNEKIPEGKETNRLHKHGYTKFKEMFNERQKLTLGMLLKEIDEIENKDVRELFLLSFSKSLESNNMFCGYDSSEGNIGHLYARHDYAPRKSPVENNVWGHQKGVRTFSKNVNSLKEAMKFSKEPVERYLEDGEHKKRQMQTPINAKVTQDTTEFEEGDADALMLCGDSSYLPISDESLDAIVTDPPYGDNVMYSELSDFFYVWLKEVLKDEYSYFSSSTVPKGTEVVENQVRGKTSEDFQDGLTAVFKESHSKLKEDGVMAFTFHHSETETWHSVLNSVISSGFYISAVYPVKSEVSQSMLIRDRGNIEYDMIIVCRKRDDEPEEGIWSEMEDRIYLEAKEQVNKLRSEDRELTQGDMFVITIGKCLEIYSKHYPEVYRDGEKVSVSDALESIQEIVDGQIMGGMFDDLANELDLISATYISYIAGRGGEIGYSSLNKNLQQRSVDISDLTDSGVVKQEGGKVVVPDLEERAEEIDSKSVDDLTAVDRAQYLVYLKEDDRLASEMHDWASEGAVKALRKLGDIENKKDYIDLADYVEEKTKNTQLNI